MSATNPSKVRDTIFPMREVAPAVAPSVGSVVGKAVGPSVGSSVGSAVDMAGHRSGASYGQIIFGRLSCAVTVKFCIITVLIFLIRIHVREY